jgi:hypothetical protein
MTPFIHWLPRHWRIRLARNFTVWGWLTRPAGQQAEEFVDNIRLITLPEMKELFPDCEILREKFLFVFTKSYVAVRSSPAVPISFRSPTSLHEGEPHQASPRGV